MLAQSVRSVVSDNKLLTEEIMKINEFIKYIK